MLLRLLLVLLALLPTTALAAPSPTELARWREHTRAVVITRDDWGIAHVRGRTDADAVFGAMHAQAEDDFNRIEDNYLTALGQRAEVEGEAAIWGDLRQRLFIDAADLRSRHAAAPAWLRRLTTAWADGLNHFLHTRPDVRPRLIARFEPWMALAFSEGSIGGDIERVSLADLRAFYGANTGPRVAALDPFPEPRGSNGIAIAPANTVAGRALLLINPHTSFFFRAELQMASDEGLNAYGAATWGQFFIYQGFNDRIGWMHTSSGVDNVDEYAETIVRAGDRLSYRHGARERPVVTRTVDIRYRTAGGGTATRRFQTHHTHHGPVIRADGDRWVTISLMNTPVPALEQSWLRTKARDHAGFERVAERRANSSNNTVFAGVGEVAYLHPQFVPRRDDRFDWAKPVDGADPATDPRGLHALAELPAVKNPGTGWIMNTNNWPYSAAGPDSPRAAAYPRYMDSFGENARGLHATALLTGRRDYTPEALIAAAYDTHQPAFATLIPALVAAWDGAPDGPAKARLRDQVAVLRGWDHRWGVASVATSLAVFWGEELRTRTAAAADAEGLSVYAYMATGTTPAQKLDALAAASDRLTRDFGTWRTPWGEINRFQRVSGAIDHPFDDAAPSRPVGFTSGVWGSLASFGAAPKAGTKRWYGTGGNSFVAVVEFGPRLRAWAVTAGGASGDPASPHFADQVERYAGGRLREVRFHPDEVARHARRTYRLGD